VKVTYFPRDEVWQALRRFARELPKRSPEVRRIIVFGSVARGDAVPGSDVDLLLVLSSSRRPFLERMSEYLPERFPVGVEIFAYTREEMEKMVAEGNWFLRRALREGKVLFDKEAA
jgi:predicted nucleotidyltransferase